MDEIINENVEISDFDALSSKGLCNDNGFTDKFYNLYKIYRRLLDTYLVEKLLLDTYDRDMDEAGLFFVPVKREDMAYYQYISTMNLKYIYLRNNIYVEKLSNEDIDKLLSLTADELKKPSNTVMKLIEDTYIDVIDVNTEKEVTCMARYGPDNNNFCLSSNELVIGIRHDDFADNGLGEEEEWEDNNNKQIMFLNVLIDEIKARAPTAIKRNINVIWYNDYTIKETVSVKK